MVPTLLDSVATEWADSALAAMGGADAWLQLKDVSYSMRVRQNGTRGATRDSESRRVMKTFPGGSSLRIETKSPEGDRVVAGCAERHSWALEDGRPAVNEAALRYACQQRAMDEWLVTLPRRLAFDREELRHAEQGILDGREYRFLDFEPGPDENLWRVGLDPVTLRPSILMWWHFARGQVPPEGRLIPSDFHHEGGLLFARRWVLWSGDGRRVVNEYEIGDLKVNQGIADSLFTGR